MSQIKDYKETLLMPKTAFEMRANLTNKEHDWRNFWITNDIYAKALKLRAKNESFILHDGPPYANGNLHIGHALNKILKDIVIRYKHLSGFYAPFILGWDTHGLPIENKMLEHLKMTKDELDPIVLRQEAKKYAQSQIEIQKDQFKLMQLFTDYKTYYKTFDPTYEANELRILSKALLAGLIYKGLKPTYWSPSSQSALAEAEIEYKDISSPQIYVKFKTTNTFKGQNPTINQLYLVIMTTTPWTLIANAGVAVGRTLDYSIVQINDQEHWIIGSALVETVLTLAKVTNFKVIQEVKGQDLLTLKYEHPTQANVTCPVVLGHHVSIAEGTGLVHIAPLFGEDDYQIGKQSQLNLLMHINEKGVLNAEANNYQGLYYLKANKVIIDDLTLTNHIIINQTIKHSAPHDWRTHQPVIYRASKQWFFNTTSIKTNIQTQLKTVKSYPEWGVSRLENMINNRDEWTISRQRTWGVPLIIFYDQTNQPIIKKELLDYVISLIEKHGSDIWWTKSVDELLPKTYQNQGWKKENDILDVWFDSGSSFLIPELQTLTTKTTFGLYLEGNDQYRGWFNSSLINSVTYQGTTPFKTLVSHGFTLDQNNQKMSKSKGNVIDPLKVIQKHGADILRLWVGSVDFQGDVTISDHILDQVALIYRNFRTKIRFMLGNLFDFNPESDYITDLKGIDALIHERLHNLKVQVKTAFDNYQFNFVIRDINQFILDLSSYYLDINKDTLYIEKANSHMRRSVQSNLYDIVLFLLKTLSIFLPTTCEEAYQTLNLKNKKFSIFFETESFAQTLKHQQETIWQDFFTLKDKVYKLLETAKKTNLIKRSQEAHLTLSSDYNHFKTWDLTKLLMVGKITFDTPNTTITPFEGIKCQRCWNYFDQTQITQEIICNRCHSVINP